MADAVVAAKANQKTPDGYYNVERMLKRVLTPQGQVLRGATWTTDGPFRKTAESSAAMRNRGLLAVEMEAAALYAFAEAPGKPVLCFAHVTNQMGNVEGDFEKGEANGTRDVLDAVAAADAWRSATGAREASR